MVSNVLKVDPAELVRSLEELRASHAGDPDYQLLRADLPAEWPI